MAIGVIGLGYVGLPLVVAFAEAGEQVVAVDVDPRKVAAIRAGESYIEDISSERLAAVLPSIQATSHYQPLARTDAVLICVPTPLTANREPDLGALIGAAEALGQVLQRGQLVVLESTTYPGHDARAAGADPRAGVRPAASATTSTSPSRPSASIPAGPITRCATPPRWSAG